VATLFLKEFIQEKMIFMALVSQLHFVMSEKCPAVYIMLVMRLYTKSW